MKRFKHNLSHYHMTSFDMGDLVPVSNVEVLPGDSMQFNTSALIRVTPQLKPLMHPIQVRIHHFFVPMRILWSGWEDFITGESATPPPTSSGAAYDAGRLQDYLGVYDNAQNDYSSLPLRAYNSIFNHYYRDQDLRTEVNEDQDYIKQISWEKDYFTTARPWAQKGSDVTLPVGTLAPVRGMGLQSTSGTPATGQSYNDYDSTVTGATGWKIEGTGSAAGTSESHMFVEERSASGKPGIYADLSDASALSIREFREAFAMQRYQEARARYGSNYVDYLRYLGIKPSDARLQRPEYLGGGRQTISFSEVLNTSDTNTGEMVGHGIAAMKTNSSRRFFEEHGYLMTMMSVRPKTVYCSGVPRKFSRTSKEDFYQKELENIGQQEILNKELYHDHTSPDGTFGYTDRYREYREEHSRVSGEFRNTNQYDWHLGRIFSSDPALNDTFVECNPTKRCFADQTHDSIWAMVSHDIKARRMVSPSPSGRIL
jgi:hypothetical protein